MNARNLIFVPGATLELTQRKAMIANPALTYGAGSYPQTPKSPLQF